MIWGATSGGAMGSSVDRLPMIALSVRQPWAWAIVYASKDIENRSEPAVRHGMRLQIGKRIAIHAAKGMTQDEYEDAAEFMSRIGVACPPAGDLDRGGIIGSVRVNDVVGKSASKWFFGPKGLCLAEPHPCAFIGATGALGMFKWCPNGKAQDESARWMQRRRAEAEDMQGMLAL